jgi:hypothetical protein
LSVMTILWSCNRRKKVVAVVAEGVKNLPQHLQLLYSKEGWGWSLDESPLYTIEAHRK